MAQLPIRQLTLYKQGIGYFNRRGLVDGHIVSLVIPREGTNDALKSLNVIVHQGGQVLSVDYETPEDKSKLLAELPVKLGGQSSLTDLFTSLRGSRITLHLEDSQTATGRIVGVQASDGSEPSHYVVLQSDEPLDSSAASIQVLSLAQTRGVSLLDDRAAADVSFFLDVSQKEQTRTALTLRLPKGQHDLEIGYLAPSPIWRVSYRIVGDGQNARLLAWGLFDNSLDEDLEDVSLTLVSGRPISFVYGLYESRIPGRPQVSDDPASGESVSTDPRVGEALATISHDLRSPLSTIMGYAELLPRTGVLSKEQQKFVQSIQSSAKQMNGLISNLLDMFRLHTKTDEPEEKVQASLYSSGPLGNLKVSSSYFLPLLVGNAEAQFMTYEVKSPISVARGQSAMVPIIDATVSYRPLCVYNGDKMPNHPLLVWRLQNSTGLALEQGPVTIIEDGRYLGEGLMRFSGAGDDIQIPYALEFGILISEASEWGDKTLWALEFDADKRKAMVSRAQIAEHTYTLSSRVDHEITVYIERRDPSRGDYVEMPDPELTMAGHSRWPVTVPPKGESSFTVRIREIFEEEEEAEGWEPEFLEELRDGGILPDPQYATLQDLFDQQLTAADALDEIKLLEEEYKQIGSRQEQLRKNLDVLGGSEREVAIRSRVLDDLETSEDRRREIEARLVELNTLVKQSYSNQKSLEDQLYDEESSN